MKYFDAIESTFGANNDLAKVQVEGREETIAKEKVMSSVMGNMRCLIDAATFKTRELSGKTEYFHRLYLKIVHRFKRRAYQRAVRQVEVHASELSLERLQLIRDFPLYRPRPVDRAVLRDHGASGLTCPRKDPPLSQIGIDDFDDINEWPICYTLERQGEILRKYASLHIKHLLCVNFLAT